MVQKAKRDLPAMGGEPVIGNGQGAGMSANRNGKPFRDTSAAHGFAQCDRRHSASLKPGPSSATTLLARSAPLA